MGFRITRSGEVKHVAKRPRVASDNYYHRTYTGYRDERRYGRTPSDRYYANPDMTQKKIKDGSAFAGPEFDPYRKQPDWQARERARVREDRARFGGPAWYLPADGPNPAVGTPPPMTVSNRYGRQPIVHEGGSGPMHPAFGGATATTSGGVVGGAMQGGGGVVDPMTGAVVPHFQLPDNVLGRFVASHYAPEIQLAVFRKLLRNEFSVPARLRRPPRRRSSPAPRGPVVIEE